MGKSGVVAVVMLAVMLTAGIGPASGQLSIGGGVNQGCISMRIHYSTCGIIPYPCAYISFWQPKWIVSTRPSQENTGQPDYHFHNAVVRPVNYLFAFNDPCGGCAVPMLAALVPAFYESFTDPAWRAAQAPVMPPYIYALKVGVWGGYYPRVGYVTHPTPVVASALAATRGLRHRAAACRPVAGVRSAAPGHPAGADGADGGAAVHVPPLHAGAAVLLQGRVLTSGR